MPAINWISALDCEMLSESKHASVKGPIKNQSKIVSGLTLVAFTAFESWKKQTLYSEKVLRYSVSLDYSRPCCSCLFALNSVKRTPHPHFPIYFIVLSAFADTVGV